MANLPSTGLSDDEAKSLFAATLRSPFADFPETHVHDWFKLLTQQFPLWSFNCWAFAAHHKTELPSTYPLPQFIRSILEDEGMSTTEQQQLGPLEANLDHRRYGLASRNTFVAHMRDDGTPFLRGDWASFARGLAYGLTDWEPESDYALGGYVSRYEDLGIELVQHIEPVVFAADKKQRAQAEKELERFLERVQAKLGKGRPQKGPSVDLLKELIGQGRELLALCWDRIPEQVSSLTAQVLRSANITEMSEQSVWALRLALPVLSLPEILTLKEEQKRALSWGRRPERPTPLRLATWMVAHRLQIDAASLARKARGADAARYFVAQPNPIDTFLP